MVRDKKLVAESEAAADLTMQEMKALMKVKMSEQEAWQASRHLFIFLTKEAIEEAYQPDRDEKGNVLPPSCRRGEIMKEKYRIFVGDNFHAHDDDEVDDGGSYSTQEEAVAAAKLIVDKSLRWERKKSNNPDDPDELFDRYMDFGDSPVIRPETNPTFSAWKYAESRCVDICQEPV